MSEAWRGAWAAALDELEMDVATTESMLADVHRLNQTPPANSWQPPKDLGRLPRELAPRADQILARQLSAAEEVARRLTSTRQQLEVTARIETGERIKRPLYLDCAM